MKVVAIGAHYDDIELACGGTLALMKSRGHEIEMIVASDSTGISFNGETMRTAEEARIEGRKGADALGVETLINLGFPNKDVPYDYKMVEAIEKELIRFHPDIIFTHWPFDTHQDHRNTALSVISAARNFNNIIFFEPFPPSGRSYMPFRCNLYMNITDYFEIKIKSLKAHCSQHKRYGDDWIEAIQGRAKLRGFESNSKYAESFEILRMEFDQKII